MLMPRRACRMDRSIEAGTIKSISSWVRWTALR